MSLGPQCHYHILGIQVDASEDQIKSSYRKLALVWHPDRNFGREEEASQMYARIQEAYDTLSDSQSRTFYDRHREAILRGCRPGETNSDGVNLMPYFLTSCFRGYGSDQFGYYAVYNDIFDQISQLEIAAFTAGETSSGNTPFPSTPFTPMSPFSPSGTTLPVSPHPTNIIDDIDDIDGVDNHYDIDDIDGVDDSYNVNDIDEVDSEMNSGNKSDLNNDVDGLDTNLNSTSEAPSFGDQDLDHVKLKQFYSYWTNFTSKRTFTWHDQYDTSEFQDRRSRRMAETHNQKVRLGKRREFNQTVRELARFVQRLDYRWRTMRANEMAEEELRRKKEIIAKKEAEAEKAIRRQVHAIEEEARLAEQLRLHREMYGEDEDEETEKEEKTIVVKCDICNRVFKSNKQMEEHQKSKKHKEMLAKWEREQRYQQHQLQKKTTVPVSMNIGESDKERLRRELLEEEALMMKMMQLEIEEEKKSSNKNPVLEKQTNLKPAEEEYDEDEDDFEDEEEVLDEKALIKLFGKATFLKMKAQGKFPHLLEPESESNSDYEEDEDEDEYEYYYEEDEDEDD